MAKGATKPEVVHVSSSDSLHVFNGLNYANADRFRASFPGYPRHSASIVTRHTKAANSPGFPDTSTDSYGHTAGMSVAVQVGMDQ